MKLIDDWKLQFPKLWSVRFALITALFAGAQAAIDTLASGQTPTLAAIACLTSVLGAVARIVAQPSLTSG